MSTALKDIYSIEFLEDIGEKLQDRAELFSAEQFVSEVLSKDWENLSVRARMQKIATVIGEQLDGTFSEQLEVLLMLHRDNRGFNYLFFPDFISIYGRAPEDFDVSLEYLEKMTEYSSSEFAIRYFLEQEPEKVLARCLVWSQSENPDIRRLASEGCRLRLPWGNHFTYLENHPTCTLPILENLKEDESLYVRKSVANHLNDLSKIAPELVIDLSKKWLNQHEDTDWIVKKACRTLLKESHPDALALFDYNPPGSTYELLEVKLYLDKEQVVLGEDIEFTYEIKTNITTNHLVRLEFEVGFVKANGKLNTKRFFLRDIESSEGDFSGTKKISFKQLSTRKHYSGRHTLRLIMNGHGIFETSFDVLPNK